MTVNNIDNLNLGSILQIAFSKGIRFQGSKDFRDLEAVGKNKIGNQLARELRFMTQGALGVAAVQYRNPGTSNRAFPSAQQASITERVARLTEIDVTVELECNIWERAMKTPMKYDDPVVLEAESKLTAAKRQVASDVWSDGTGIIIQVLSVASTTGSGAGVDQSVVTTDESDPVYSTSPTGLGFVGRAQIGDLLLAATIAGVVTNPTVAGSFYGWKITDRDRKNNTVTLQPVDSSGNPLAMSASNLVATMVFYRVGMPLNVGGTAFTDLTAAGLYNGTSEWANITDVFPGLEILSNSFGGKVHSVANTGLYKGTRNAAGGALLDVPLIHELMDNVKVNVGRIYDYTSMVMSPEAQRSFIESRETDRRFISATDGDRGTPRFRYHHEDDVLAIATSEFLKKSRVFCLPEGRGDQGKVVEIWGTDFASVKGGPGSNDWYLKPASAGGYVNMMQHFMRSYMTMLSHHNASIAVLTGFTL